MKKPRVFERLKRRFQFELGNLRGVTLDVSAGGMNLELTRTPAPGSTVVGNLILGTQKLSFTGLVAWVLPAFPNAGIRGKVGIRLTGIPPEYFNTLAGR
jgi:hypothetical protein